MLLTDFLTLQQAKMAPKWNRITSMVIAKLCSGDYDFEGNNRAASTQSQMYAIPVSDPANDITPVSGPDSATANGTTPGPTRLLKLHVDLQLQHLHLQAHLHL